MIDELYELEEAAAELELISATLYALNIAMCDGKTLVDSNAFFTLLQATRYITDDNSYP